jgi:hypothetical protein
MGYRGWLTPIEDAEDWRSFSSALERNDSAYGVDYVIRLEKAARPFKKGKVVAAWSGDGNGSLTGEMPECYRARTVFLDDHVQSWGDPSTRGTFFKNTEDVESYFASEKRP